MIQTQYNQEYEARLPRLDVQTAVRILASDQSKVFSASAKNISESGMFVTSQDTLSVNSELLCEIALPGPGGRIQLKGRVIWVKKQPQGGMGIEFLEVSENDRLLLREIVKTFLECDRRPVKVWLETLPQPIQAQATYVEDGVLLRSELNFLRLNSQVLISPASSEDRGQSYSGILQNISLAQPETQCFPVLELHMALEASKSEGSVQADTSHASYKGQAELIIEPAYPTPDEVVIDLQPLIEINNPDGQSTVEMEISETAELPKTGIKTPELPSLVDDNSAWDMTLAKDSSAESQWHLSSPQEEPQEIPGGRRGYFWLWVAALLMLSVTVASIFHTGLWQKARTQISGWFGIKTAKITTKESSVTKESTATKTTNDSSEQKSPQTIVRHAQNKTVASKSVKKESTNAQIPASSKALELAKKTPLQAGKDTHREKRQNTFVPNLENVLTIPLQGNTKGAHTYPLGNPDGLAINLPNARALAHFGTYHISHQAFRLVWIRRRDSGSQLRIMVHGKLPKHKVEIRDTEVRIHLIMSDDKQSGSQVVQ